MYCSLCTSYGAGLLVSGLGAGLMVNLYWCFIVGLLVLVLDCWLACIGTGLLVSLYWCWIVGLLLLECWIVGYMEYEVYCSLDTR